MRLMLKTWVVSLMKAGLGIDMAMNNPPEFYVVVTEHDTDQRQFPHMTHGSNGSIVHEIYLHQSALNKVIDRKKYLGDKFGKAVIAKLVFLSDSEIELLSE